jgi:hypothetical protein
MRKSSLLPTVVLLIALGILLVWRAPVRTKILLVVLVVPASMISSALTGYAISLGLRRYHEYRIRKSMPKPRGTLRITKSGRAYVDSPAYELQILGLVGQFWKPDKSFYELLLITTAMCLSDCDPATAGPLAFKQFIVENLPAIRTAIDRIKTSQPAIKMSEESWERSQSLSSGLPAGGKTS